MYKSSNKTYFITGGGTGGHIYPAVAVADELIKNETNTVYYVGNPDNMEHKIAEKKGYNFLPVYVKGMPRKLSLHFIIWAVQLSFAIFKAMYYILKYKPDAIFGTGGYVSAPLLFAANILRKPNYMLHDCDIRPGIVTRQFAKNAKCVSLAFKDAEQSINNENCHINGNPLRPEFKQVLKIDAKEKLGLNMDKPVLCVMGGSQGAKSINNSFVEIIKELVQDHGYQIIFQTGEKNYSYISDRLSKIFKHYEKNKNLIVKPYFENMVDMLKASDIVISRAGSLSLSEIFASGTAPILIPYPHAAADHQRKNARFVEENNACIYVEDEEVDPNYLLKLLIELKDDPQRIKDLKSNASKLAKLDALKDIVEQFERISV